MSEAPLMLSVSGLRGLVGQSLTPEVAARYGAAFGSWLREQSGEVSPLVALGRDSRPSGEMVELATVSGLVGVGCRVVRLGVASTPGVAIMVQKLGAAGGMVITASHNPIIWNGIKALRHDGVAPPPEQAQAIVERFRSEKLDWVAVDALQAVSDDRRAATVHRDLILPHIDVESIRGRKLKVVVDSVHGAGGEEAKLLLDALGVELVHLYAEPTGLFPHTPEPTKENLTGLCDAVKSHGADIGFAQDPDADRLAIVDERGVYIGEEYTLALSAMRMIDRAGGQPVNMAANLSTSRMLDDLAARCGGQVVRTPVGEANVAKGMKTSEAPIGGEGNGGIIWPIVSYVRDSLAGMALVLELLAARGTPLSSLVAEIPAYAIVKQKMPVDADLLAVLEERMRGRFGKQHIDTQDGVRVDWPDRWVHVRPSNTEPIIRLIAEASDEEAALGLIREVEEALGERDQKPGG